MRIVKANLCYRFYTSDGWTREGVLDLYKNIKLSHVIPRYYDMDDDKKTMNSLKFHEMPEDLNQKDWSNCDYFAVYLSSAEINHKELSRHDVQ